MSVLLCRVFKVPCNCHRAPLSMKTSSTSAAIVTTNHHKNRRRSRLASNRPQLIVNARQSTFLFLSANIF